MTHRFILLDRDGTINVDTHYLSQPEEVTLERNAAKGLREMQNQGFRLAVLTNQSGIGRRYFDLTTVAMIHRTLDSLLLCEGVTIAGYFVCPHHPNEHCTCRKPHPGLAEQAQAQFGFSFAETWVIGDKESDIGLGHTIGAKTLLVRTGKGAQTETTGHIKPDAVVDDLLDAAREIMQRETLFTPKG